VLLLGGVLALARAGVAPSPLTEAVWPILGSMFMFRLALYLHAMRYDAAPRSLSRTLAYFFMLPNVCYPLFPVVDYTTFARTHYDSDERAIYERGVKWIVRGLVHLLLYRLVYLHFTLEVTEVRSLGTLVQSLLAVFFLYLRISGQFHLIVGMLHLFGFHLPETHRLYFLASSITDYWRRINIYWKDFMMKLVYYPSFFRLRSGGDRVALVGATMIVFFATWVLHSYQWFWLRSEFPITAQDIAFWGLLGGLVVFNSLREARRGRKRTLAAPKRDWNVARALRTVGTFTLLCVLWSLWSTESIVEWLWMWSAAGHVEMRDAVFVLSLLAIGLAVGGVNWDAPVSAPTGAMPLHRRPMVQSLAVLVLLLAAASPRVQQQTPPLLAGTLQSLQSTSLNRRDAALQQKGYYENLDDRGRLSMQLWEVVAQRPADWTVLGETDAWRRRDDFLQSDLRPDTRVTLAGVTVSINRWGMRDREYTLEKPPGTRRIALLGPSYVMGIGVSDEETFDAHLERRLNASAAHAAGYEVLNFGVGAYSLLQQMRMLEERVFAFDPDVVVITDSPRADMPLVAHLTGVLSSGVAIPYPGLDSIVRAAGIRDFPGEGMPVPTHPLRAMARAVGLPMRMPWREANLRLYAVADEIMAWSLAHMAHAAREHGAVPVFLALGQVSDTAVADSPIMANARAAGFVVLNLFDLYDGQDRDALRVAPWDDHPNAHATPMIADRLYRELQNHEAELRLGLTPAAALRRAEEDQQKWTTSRAQ
jgi:D-alanyl-lipoteichoic acid acyltransferase DltB (MBOAT superfamily)